MCELQRTIKGWAFIRDEFNLGDMLVDFIDRCDKWNAILLLHLHHILSRSVIHDYEVMNEQKNWSRDLEGQN